MIEAQVAARLLSRVGAPQLDAVLAGERLATVALHPATADRARSVVAGTVADDAVVLVDDCLVLVPLSGRVTPIENLGSMPLADVVGVGGEVVASGPDARRAHDAATDEWLLLTPAALVGIGSRSLEIGVEYAKERIAFDVPIGSFQAISHPLADSATAIEKRGRPARSPDARRRRPPRPPRTSAIGHRSASPPKLPAMPRAGPSTSTAAMGS